MKTSIVFDQGRGEGRLRVGVRFELAPGWHIYTQQPGEVGLPTTIRWSAPAGITLSPPEWPAAEVFEYQGIRSNGYSREVRLWSDLGSSKEMRPGTFSVKAEVSWLACSDECQPGSAKLERQITLPPLSRAIPSTDAFATANLSVGENRVELSDERVDTFSEQFPSQPDAGGVAFILVLWFALLGGILLNVMPCVFPVLSLKIMGLMLTHNSREMRIHAITYGFGVLTSFWALALTLNVARLCGATIGWGFQFQSPNFVFCLVIIVFVIALNMVGLFEFGYGIQNKAGSVKIADGAAGAFLSGVLATALATPCTGPFMGSAIAAALTMSGWKTVLVFTSLGTGMALPYMVLCWYPACRRFLPRPGGWMDLFKQLLAFPLFMTMVWLMWVLGCQVGMNGVGRALVSLVVVGLTCWGFGQLCSADCSRARQRFASCAALGMLAVALLIGTPWSGYISESNVASASTSLVNWEKFSAQKLADLRKKGIPVVVDFTAAWCVVCQINEQRIFNSTAIVEPLLKGGAVFLRADWTKRDDEITEELSRHGVVGIPLVIVYGTSEKPATFSSLIEPATFSNVARRLIPTNNPENTQG